MTLIHPTQGRLEMNQTSRLVWLSRENSVSFREGFADVTHFIEAYHFKQRSNEPRVIRVGSQNFGSTSELYRLTKSRWRSLVTDQRLNICGKS